ncbi:MULTISPECIES: HAD family hydrolase [Holdemanella]|uniref:HAD family hydrolase n=1 Tax=Holdemanella TaxID=1573535 RepID=UPI0024308AE9|nr:MULTISPECIES: HAD family phosphatase [Holdemanella]MCI7165469.1 HAD family phosphatase [Holdemanella sp.]MDD6453050.1 HAD family phosphatase [Holdemanella porci]MDY5473765.1 HAD family phosphatase [Holdemanella porci]
MNYSIFDVDGTILDSMEVWNTLASQYVQSLGKVPEKNLDEIVSDMSLEQSATYLKNHYKINKQEERIISEILNFISDFYEYEVNLMPGFKEFISHYDSINVIGTSCDEELVKIALNRLGVLNYFEDIITCSKVNKSKDDSDFYLACAQALKQRPEDIVVFEDADYCIDVARKVGFKVIKIKDWRDLNEKCVNDCGK